MLSKANIKALRSYRQKKVRDAENVFVAEGPKLVKDLIPYFGLNTLVIQQEHIETFVGMPHEIATENDIAQFSLQKNPQGVFALFKKREVNLASADPTKELIIALDGIQDPGNLGTIIRTCDWFGIKHIVCSEKTVDLYNPKVVQSTMGALGRVSVHYTKLEAFLKGSKAEVMGTFLNGDNIFTAELPKCGIIVLGNEGKGISLEIEMLVGKRLFIPSYPKGLQTSESLNVSIATAIICSEFRRRML